MPPIYLYAALLFLITCAGGSVPIIIKSQGGGYLKYLLAFSGAFLLGITVLHLIPENVALYGQKAAVLIFAGFFLQQFVQRFTHGVEHGHIHTHHSGEEKISVIPIFVGLSLHAFSEGLPLGVSYTDHNTLPSLYFAIALHKIPEAMLITTLVQTATHNKRKSLIALILFALVTPVAALLSYYLGNAAESAAKVIAICIPVVAGSFLHIATTIFFESGTRSHEMNWKKWLATLSGGGLALLTLMGE